MPTRLGWALYRRPSVKITARQPYDCAPTLDDSQILQLCRQGYLMFKGVVPQEINERTCAFLDEHPQGEPTAIFQRDWFVDGVILQPDAAGAVRSVLGAPFGLPILISNHRMTAPFEAQDWHHDADAQFGPAVDYLQVFYYPQDTPPEWGPTEILPGSHVAPSPRQRDWQGGLLTSAPAGSIFVTIYPILHRRSRATAQGRRNLLKYNYWRLAPPRRDWLAESDFDFHGADYGGHFLAPKVAHMFFWLCGMGDQFRTIGGQGWPYSGSRDNQVDKPYGFPGALGD